MKTKKPKLKKFRSLGDFNATYFPKSNQSKNQRKSAKEEAQQFVADTLGKLRPLLRQFK